VAGEGAILVAGVDRGTLDASDFLLA